MSLTEDLVREEYCYLTTRGRVTGKPHEIEIWFGSEGDRVYMLAGGRDRSDWVRNLRADPSVDLRIASTTWRAKARLVTAPAEDALARRLLLDKYQRPGAGDLEQWGREALAVAVDLSSETILD